MGLSKWLEHRRAAKMGHREEVERRSREVERQRLIATAAPRPVPTVTTWLSGAGKLGVVGESHYQAALHLACEGAVAERFDRGTGVTCALVPELSNKYDNNAVRVDCLTEHGAVTVGYIDRHNAPDYQYPLLTQLPRGTVALCRGMIMGGGQKTYGIWLSVGDPASFIIAGERPDRHEVLKPDKTVALTGEQNYAEALTRLHGGKTAMVRRYAALRPCEITGGKSAGAHTIEAVIDGETVGQLTTLMGRRYLPLLRDDIPMCCEALITRGEKRYEVTLHLPTMPN